MPKSELRRDVLVVPYQKPWVGGAENAPPYAQVIRTRRKTRPEPVNVFPGGEAVATVSGAFLYGGPLKVHFGHVIVDSIPRLHAYDPHRHKGVIFPVLLNDKPIPTWVYDIFALFGLSGDAVHVVHQPTRFESVDFVEAGTWPYPTPQWYLDYLRKLPYRRHADTPPNIYLGRTHIIRKGTMMGESYFGGQLEGFEYVKPEEHDISVQISMFANAKRIVFTEGSAGYVACLLPKLNAQVYMLPRRAGDPGHFAEQFVGRAEFHSLGDSNQLVRLNHAGGREGPRSPSYTLAPDLIHHDLRRYGLTREGFDLSAFLAAERHDAQEYFGRGSGMIEAQLADITGRRGDSGVASLA